MFKYSYINIISMLQRFSTKQLIFLALIGAILFIMDLVISTVIDAVTGMQGAGYLVIGIFFIMIAVIGGLIIPKFGVFALMALIYALLAIPTNVFGPPGILKVPIAFIVGLIIDLIIYSFKYKKSGYYLGAIIGNVLSLILFVWTFLLLGLPGIESLMPYLWSFSILYGIEAVIGTWLGYIIFNKKLKNLKIIKQIEV